MVALLFQFWSKVAMETRNYEDVAAEKPLFGEATRKVISLPFHYQLTTARNIYFRGRAD